MIKLQSVNKYYAKGKNNELHVINDATLELPAAGFISFFGKSGSGKTTLLNVVGGLDGFDRGSISYDGREMKKYSMSEADKYRRSHVGYIFQNYLLLENKSVYDNLRLALETLGVTDEEEQQKRIKYVLTAVGLYKFRKKPAGNLSGGQMQRVSIARALLKECRVIIADEPTGNLDSENTIEVMNILKKISKKTLVLLVTHNREIADFYSDRVVEISDGKITADYEGQAAFGEERQAELNVKHEKKIYLKDLKKEELNGESVKLNFYTGEDSPRKIELNVVVKGNTVYLDSPNPENLVVVREGNIELINDHYKAMKKEDVNEFQFDISWYDDSKKQPAFKRFLSSFKRTMSAFWRAPIRKRIFHFIFFFIGMMTGVCLLALNSYGSIDVSSSSNEPGVYLLADEDAEFGYYETPALSVDKRDAAIEAGYITAAYVFSPYGNYTNISYSYNTQRRIETTESCYFYSYSDLSSDYALLAGSAPTAKNQAVLGKKIADSYLSALGFDDNDYQRLLGLELQYNLYGTNYTVCGVSEANTNSAYIQSLYYEDSKSDYYYGDVNVFYTKDVEYDLVQGTEPTAKNEILIRAGVCDGLVGKEITADVTSYFLYTTVPYTVTGTFTPKGETAAEILTLDPTLAGGSCYLSEQIQSITVMRYYHLISTQSMKEFTGEVYTAIDGNSRLPEEGKKEALVHAYSGYSLGDKLNGTDIIVAGYFYDGDLSSIYDVYLTDVAKVSYVVQTADYYGNIYYRLTDEGVNGLKALGIKAYTPTEYNYRLQKENQSVEMLIFLVIALILLAFIVIYVYFSTRSRLISQIRSVGIYRCMGATRWQIIRKYMAEILVETIFTTLIGYLIVIFAYSFLYDAFLYMNGVTLALNPFFAILGVAVLFAVNLVFGLLPVVLLLRKTPAEINSEYDI